MVSGIDVDIGVEWRNVIAMQGGDAVIKPSLLWLFTFLQSFGDELNCSACCFFFERITIGGGVL
jgi:hypothetical protein